MRYVLILVGLFVVSGCTMFQPVAAVEGVTALGTGKPFSDHVVSMISGKNCSTIRTNTGRSYCEEEEPNPQPKVWCYRSIGAVTCYDRPDPHRGNQNRVGNNDHNLVKE